MIQFLDGGKPYDPLAKEDADTSVEALEEREGGLGILLVKRTMDDVKRLRRRKEHPDHREKPQGNRRVNQRSFLNNISFVCKGTSAFT